MLFNFSLQFTLPTITLESTIYYPCGIAYIFYIDAPFLNLLLIVSLDHSSLFLLWGYYEFLDAIADPKHEQHDDLVDWTGGFDPEEFDSRKTNNVMRRGLPDWRRYQ
jgi:hypothetical protein